MIRVKEKLGFDLVDTQLLREVVAGKHEVATAPEANGALRCLMTGDCGRGSDYQRQAGIETRLVPHAAGWTQQGTGGTYARSAKACWIWSST